MSIKNCIELVYFYQESGIVFIQIDVTFINLYFFNLKMAQQGHHDPNSAIQDAFLTRLGAAYLIKTKAQLEKMKSNIRDPNNGSKESLEGFLKQENFLEALYAFMPGKDTISLANQTPPLSKYKKKGFIILRVGKQPLTEETVKSDIIFVEMTQNLLEHMYTFCNQIIGPIMQNPDNQAGWSDLVTKDLMDRFNNFVAQNYVMIGLSKGRTLLPLPNKKIMNSEGSEKDKAHIFQGCIVTWTKQIKNVLKLEPEQALKNGNNPGPMTQLEFWENKASNLNSIYDQLQSVQIKGILRFLERSKSTYTNPFTKLQREVYDARVEANENTKFLETLREPFNQLCDDTQQFQNLHELFPPIMHTFLKIYTHSRFYNTPPRLVVLIKETCNQIIARASEYINGGAVASALNSPQQIGQVCKKLQTTIDICGKFKQYYFEYKKLSEGKWKLTLNALFSRLDAYSQRCHDILHLTTTIMQFNKLEKIQLGGTKGKTLTETLKQISDEFKKAVENFRGLPYDTMDITQKTFDDDFKTFRQKIKQLERRLASVITQGFDDNDTIMGKFKLLDCFEGILNRPIIQDQLQKKHAILLDMYKQDLKSVQTIFLEGKILIQKNDQRSPIYNNYPPVAGTLTWCKTLKDRINQPFKKLESLGNGITERQQYKDVQRLHGNIQRIIQDYEESKFVFWEKEVDENTNQKLKQSLLCKDESPENKENGLLKVNFDHTLVRLLREVKYLKLLGSGVPQTAEKLFSKAETYRTQVVSLQLIVQNYNKIVTCLNDVEEPLVKKKIVAMDQEVAPGITKYRWDSPQINQFIRKSKDVVDSLYQIVDKMKKSLESIYTELQKLKKPMIERKNKPISPEQYDNILKAVIANKLGSVKDCGVAIHKLLKQVNDAVKFDKKQPEWKKYTQYINTIVTDGICEGICFALDHLNEQINSQKMDQSPLFEIKLELEGKRGVVYEPEIDKSQGNIRSVCDTLRGWINEIFSIAHNFPRLDATTSGSSGGTTGDYLIQTRANFSVKFSMSRISTNLSLIVKKTQNIKHDLKKYSYLWQEHPEENFSKFLQQNEPKPDKEQLGQDNIKRQNILLKGCREVIPNLELFDEKITKLKQLQIQVSKIQTPVEKAWIKIDLRNFIKALQVKIHTYMKVYTDFLTHQFKTTLKNLKQFNHRTTLGLKTNPKDVFASTENPNERQKQKNRGILMKVMRHISEMKSVKGSITGIVERMRNMVIKLKKHGINVTEKGQQEPLQAIEASEGAFNETEKKVNEIKKDIINIIGDEAIEVKKKLDAFNIKVNQFKTDFKANLPYTYDENVTIPQILKNYEKIDAYYVKLLAFEQQAKQNAELEDLFQLERRHYKPLKECLSDLKNLKTLWDLITMVNLQYNDWKTKLWRQIKADVLIEQNKIFQKQIKDVPKDVRVFKGCVAINDKVQNMNVVLNLVESLRGDYMEDRHWQQLKNKTKSDIDYKSPSFSFNQILELKLHKLKPEVQEIVDIAQKEFKIDKKLRIIESNWAKQIFQFEMYKQWYIFAPLDDMMEILDANSLDLMGMKAQGKYVQFFIKTVEDWREKLGRVDAVVNQWLKVQKNWRILVNIFVGSDDIRQQLPEDTKVFETVHGQFTEMMIAAHESPLIIEACNEGRKTALVQMSAKIKKCEKALNDYLQQKKKVFPRFYFLSNQSLLTILSNGQNPPKVCQFIGDCFDGLKTLRFKPSANPNQFSRIADGMYSKDDQQINFSTNFVAEGQVELWLKSLQFKMRSTLYEVLSDAKSTCETWDTGTDKPRQEWIRDYCSQLALLTTQIVWTQDVNRAFEELSSGAQSAMKQCVEVIKNRINKLIIKVTKPLDVLERMKVINIITIDVHSRDVVQSFVNFKVTQAESFPWQSQLKFEWSMDKNNDVSSRQFCRFPWQSDNTKSKCIIRIVDWFRFYSYEYVGNTLRLVITPLTDRCYITLTQALNLVMGGAPAGPAGTGKTETTKDLGRAVGLPVMVFNCSDQMNKDSMAQIFMGLCQSGAWGCFDEFNRISIEVLSVVSTQVKTCLDAQKQKKRKFLFLQEGEINLEDTAGFFITMNPGYAGRTQLPDNLKALFRSCAMVVPDLILICENMLMSEGFVLARQLSKKFVALYMLSRELLSKQRHYDWGLRAVKSVLRQAGKLKRDPDNEKMAEDPLLMRALRDFNLPKIVTDDKPIFIRLIEDLFPNQKPEKKKPSKLQKLCEVTTKNDMGLYLEEQFVIKCIDLSDILDVRHCMFIIGPPGCGKTTVWKTLLQTHKNNKQDGQYDTLNPKAVTSDQLFGCYTKSKEWRNGVLSMIMKNQNKCEEKYKKTHVHKWSILDGDVDPQWIQSLNTVMDDNKVLTLVSNDRIPLTPSMRLLFEVSNLRNATPATVSRGGVLFINETDIGWQPFVNSWLDRSQPYMKANDDGLSLVFPPINEIAKAVFFRCFQSYIQTPSDMMDQTKITYLAPPSTMGFIQTICTILDGILLEVDKTIISLYGSTQMQQVQKIVYQALFIFATMWAYGGSVGGGQDDNQVLNKFNGVFRSLVKVKFPQGGLCYDYFYSIEQNKWAHWSSKIPQYKHTDEAIFSKIFVPTIHTTRLRYLLDLHLKRRKPALFVGGAGTGKTQVIKDYLFTTKPEQVAYKTINFSSFTDAGALQKNIQAMLDKKSGKTYGSAMNKTLIAFIDDLNMPYVDKYGTQSPIQLLRQIIDYGSIFNRQQLQQRKYIQDLLFFACLNHKSGSFTVDLRLQKNFSSFTMYTPTDEIIKRIFGEILRSHLASPGFDDKLKLFADKIMDSTVMFFTRTIRNPQFSPSAKKFHYQFNFRQLAKIIEGVLRSVPQIYKNTGHVLRLWYHEIRRVFEDRFINNDDLTLFRTILKDSISKTIGDFPEKDSPFIDPIIYTSFMGQFYGPVEDIVDLRRVMKQKLDQYNDVKAQMNLVLFDQAIEHVCRITRIIQLPGGHALLVGVGGSGKQSLARLSAFIVGFQLEQMVVTQSFGMNDLRNFLSEMYRKIAKPNSSTRVYMITDSQIKLQSFLIPINDMLNSGWISDLFPKEDFDAMVGNLRNQAKGNGIPDNLQSLLSYFFDRMKKSLKIILCFSPVGEAMRVRARKFPGIINSTSIDWFHPWPRDALIDVANKFLQQTELQSQELREKIAINMAQTHLSIDVANDKFRKLERRNNYTTPKSFLELISFYKTLLQDKKGQIDRQIKRYTLGLQILAETKSKVEGLQEQLKVKMIEVKKQSQETQVLIEEVSTQSSIAEQEQAKANEQETKTNIQKDAAEKLASQCAVALAEAEPALKQAEEAVKCLQKKHVGEMKAFANPPPGVIVTCRVVLALLKEKILAADPDDKVWKKSQNLMQNPEKFLERVMNFDGTEIQQSILDVVNKIIEDPSKKYTQKDMVTQSFAASKLCAWSVNIVTFNRIYKKVRPLQQAKDKANQQLDKAMKELAVVKQQVRQLNEKVDKLKEKLAAAQKQKKEVQQDADRCQNKLTAAQKLVNGLSGQNKRWSENVLFLKANIRSVIGDVLLASQFVSYIGAFSSKLRRQLWQDIWLPNIVSKSIPFTEGIQPLKILTTQSLKARWKNEGLPADNMSFENASIISSCSRWPLLIDPQLQGSSWIRGSQGDNLSPININQKHWMRQLTKNISDGRAVLLEGIQQQIQATLDPLLSRAIVKKAGSYSLQLGSQVIDYDPKFKLFLMTKLTNPHFRPEIAAQCTIINFIVTQSGLEQQLLAMVVNVEKNELQVQKQELVKKQNEFQVILDDLQSSLLKQLSEADPATILDNKDLINNLQKTKLTAISISEQAEQAKKTEININAQREIYRPVAAEGAMLYFLCISLCIIDHMYQYSLESFIKFFFKAIERTQQKDQTRVVKLIENIRFTIYQWISRGLFEKHKLIFLTMITFRLMQKKIIQVNYTLEQMDFLIKGIPRIGVENPLDWLPDIAWNMVQALSQLQEFKTFAINMEKDAPTRFKDWYNQLTPEDVKLPLEWKKLDQTPFKKLCVLRALRPDRITVALGRFIREALPKGQQFIDMDSKSSFVDILTSSVYDSQPQIPIFFILSPGSDPVKQVEKVIKKQRDRFRIEPGKSFFNISLGQGQDQIARRRIQEGNKQGHWIMLQNIHLMPTWLIQLEKILDSFSGDTGSHVNFRLFLSAEPSTGVPIGLLDRSIKLTNQPPAGLKANMKRAFTYFPKQQIEEKQAKVKCILFGLCFFHSTVIERKRFGPMGWNMSYPFNMGDLRDSYLVLNRYMQSASGSSKIPFEDLIYIFGEIMYGGHIVDDWDRRLARAYLQNIMCAEIFEQIELFPYIDGKNVSFRVPLPTNYEKYLEHIQGLGAQTPLAYGLHPNAEIGFRTTQCNTLFQTLLDIAPKDTAAAGGEGARTTQDILQQMVKRFAEDINIKSLIFSVDDIKGKLDADQKGPYQNVFIQQIEYMTILLTQIARSIEQIDQGIKGLLTISEKMEQTMDALVLNRVPVSWTNLAYPSKRGLEGWIINLLQRIQQLNMFKDDPLTPPKVIMISKFFNPQSYLTAIKQVVAANAKGGYELNKLYIQTDITKKSVEEIEGTPKDGAYCFGFILQGARWDIAGGYVEQSKPKEMFSVIPVVYCKALPLPPEGKQDKTVYQCPAYKTEDRGNTYVFTAQLKTRHPPRKWILAGVAIIMDVEGLSDDTGKKKQKK